MELLEFLEFINFASEKELDEKLYFRWCLELPHMQKRISYQEYKDILTGKNIDRRPAAEIMEEIRNAHKRMGNGVNIHGNI